VGLADACIPPNHADNVVLGQFRADAAIYAIDSASNLGESAARDPIKPGI
jgi:hypothetical protein